MSADLDCGMCLCAALVQPGTALGAACGNVVPKLSRHSEGDISLVLARLRPGGCAASP